VGVTLGAILFGTGAAVFRERAAALEELGFGSFSVGDHLQHYPPLAACAAIAEGTERAQVGPLVLNNDFRNPSVLAREAVAVSELSGGRFELGLGAGYARREYVWAGIRYDPGPVRIARLAEATEILSRLLAGEEVTFRGEHYAVEADSLRERPYRVPLLIGGNSVEVHAIAARHADILNLIGLSPKRGGTVEDLSDFSAGALDRQLNALRGFERDAGAELERHVLVQWHHVTGDRQEAAERAAKTLGVPPSVVLDSPYVLIGSPTEIAEQLRDHHERFGIARWTIFADRPDLQRGEELAPVLGELDKVARAGSSG
jgi:probable F420-dependent oxidoreductase